MLSQQVKTANILTVSRSYKVNAAIHKTNELGLDL